MMARWGICACLVVLLVLSAGCRTTPPNLKPAPEKEVLNPPPNNPKYASPAYPDQAFDKQIDPSTLGSFDSKKPGAMPGGRGGMGGPGMGMGN